MDIKLSNEDYDKFINACKDNPELPKSFILDALKAIEEINNDETELCIKRLNDGKKPIPVKLEDL